VNLFLGWHFSAGGYIGLFSFEKIPQSRHIWRKNNSQVTIFRQNFPEGGQNKAEFYFFLPFPVWPLTKFGSFLLWMIHQSQVEQLFAKLGNQMAGINIEGQWHALRRTLKGRGSPSQGPSPDHSGAAHVTNQIMTLKLRPGFDSMFDITHDPHRCKEWGFENGGRGDVPNALSLWNRQDCI
jgi:hypothetical protein